MVLIKTLQRIKQGYEATTGSLLKLYRVLYSSNLSKMAAIAVYICLIPRTLSSLKGAGANIFKLLSTTNKVSGEISPAWQDWGASCTNDWKTDDRIWLLLRSSGSLTKKSFATDALVAWNPRVHPPGVVYKWTLPSALRYFSGPDPLNRLELQEYQISIINKNDLQDEAYDSRRAIYPCSFDSSSLCNYWRCMRS